VEAKFKEVAEAYAVLLDLMNRADYGVRGFPGVRGMALEGLTGSIFVTCSAG